MEVSLKVTVGKSAGREIPINGPKFYIGRADDCQLRPNSDLISRHHCVLMVEEGFVAVRDFGSKNGTYVNGERVVGECEIKPGDSLKVGPLQFELCFRGGLGGKKRSKVRSIEEAAARTAQNVPEGDIDISQWVADAEGDGAETRRMSLHETDTIELKAQETTSAPRSPSADLSEAEEEQPSQSRKPKSGKLKLHTKHSDNSQDAAADALRQFFKRR